VICFKPLTGPGFYLMCALHLVSVDLLVCPM
jgi:hypothetical protein